MPDKDFERWEREQAVFDDAPEGEKQRIVATRNNNALLAELRFIRWILLGIAVVAVAAIQHWWPDWWHTPWWPR